MASGTWTCARARIRSTWRGAAVGSASAPPSPPHAGSTRTWSATWGASRTTPAPSARSPPAGCCGATGQPCSRRCATRCGWGAAFRAPGPPPPPVPAPPPPPRPPGAVPYAVEVNPRYCASMELVERARGISIFAVHARACAGELPDLVHTRPAADVVGKAIVYAREDVVPEGTARWLEDDDVRDAPAPGEGIARGHPICTVFARGRSVTACGAALAARARTVYRSLDAHGVRIA